MNFDELKKTWQSQQSHFEVTIDSTMLLKEIRRNKRYFESIVFKRDVLEVGVGIVMFILFLYWGLTCEFWSLYGIALSVAFIVVFLVVDRFLSYRKRPKCNDTLLGCITSSLQQVEHQVWLLKNVLWWYLLPPGIAISIFIFSVAIEVIKKAGVTDSAPYLLFLVVYLVSLILFFWGIYWLNQRAVRKELLPRREELERLLHSLKNSDA